MVPKRSQENMDMVRHDDEFIKPVTLSIEEPKGIFHDLPVIRVRKRAIPVTGIKPLLKTLAS